MLSSTTTGASFRFLKGFLFCRFAGSASAGATGARVGEGFASLDCSGCVGYSPLVGDMALVVVVGLEWPESEPEPTTVPSFELAMVGEGGTAREGVLLSGCSVFGGDVEGLSPSDMDEEAS